MCTFYTHPPPPPPPPPPTHTHTHTHTHTLTLACDCRSWLSMSSSSLTLHWRLSTLLQHITPSLFHAQDYRMSMDQYLHQTHMSDVNIGPWTFCSLVYGIMIVYNYYTCEGAVCVASLVPKRFRKGVVTRLHVCVLHADTAAHLPWVCSSSLLASLSSRVCCSARLSWVCRCTFSPSKDSTLSRSCTGHIIIIQEVKVQSSSWHAI